MNYRIKITIIMTASMISFCWLHGTLNNKQHSTIALNQDKYMMMVDKIKCEYCGQSLTIESEDTRYIEKKRDQFQKQHKNCEKKKNKKEK